MGTTEKTRPPTVHIAQQYTSLSFNAFVDSFADQLITGDRKVLIFCSLPCNRQMLKEYSVIYHEGNTDERIKVTSYFNEISTDQLGNKVRAQW